MRCPETGRVMLDSGSRNLLLRCCDLIQPSGRNNLAGGVSHRIQLAKKQPRGRHKAPLNVLPSGALS